MSHVGDRPDLPRAWLELRFLAMSGCSGHCHCLDEPPTTSSQAHTTMELLEPLDPMFAIGLDLPCKRIPAVELEMRDRDEMHLLSVVNAKIENARYTAFVAQVPHISNATLIRRFLHRTLLQSFPQPHGRKCTHGQRCLHSLHQCHGFFYVIDHGFKAQLDERSRAALETNANSQEVILDKFRHCFCEF